MTTQVDSSRSTWLIDRVNDRISRISTGPFFQFLGVTEDRAGLSWVHQLTHMSLGFIQAILFRAARCGRRVGHGGEIIFLRSFLEHAFAECRHPPELEDWARAFGFVGAPGTPAFCGEPRTPATERLLDHVWLIAEHGTPEEQVVVMNMVAEGVALSFYRAALATLQRLGMNLGRYWRVHMDSDADHALLGSDLVLAEEGSDLGARLLGLASLTLDLFEQMLSSWVPADAALEPSRVSPAGRLLEMSPAVSP